MKILLLSALLLAAAADSTLEDKLRGWVGSQSWQQGAAYCDGDLFVELSRRPDPRNISTGSLSRVATYCAALAGGNGDEAGSGWWWYTAVSLDQKEAQRLLPELQKAGLLQKLPAPRSRTSHGPLADGKIQRPTGEIVEGVPPRVLDKPKPPASMFPSIRGVASATVEVELVVPRTGVPQQPLLLKAKALPVHVFNAYHFLRTWHFEPAKVGGEPVDSIDAVTISLHSSG
jgi:hypothetical protein